MKSMKLESKICKAVSTKKVNVNGIDTVLVKDGFGYVTNLEMFVKFKTEIPDGTYEKEFIEKMLLQRSQHEHNFEIPNRGFSGSSFMSKEVVTEIINSFPFSGNDDLRPVMMGCYVKGTDICSTDAHRLYWREDLETGVKNGVIMHRMLLPLLKLSTNGFKIYEEDSESPVWFKIECDDFEVICRNIEGKYPNYKAIIPNEKPYSVQLPKKQLEDYLKEGINYTNKTTKMVKFVFDKEKATLIFEDIDRGFSSVKEIKTESNIDAIFTIGWNTKFILEYLKTLDKKQEFVTIEMSAPSRASIFDGVYLLMPQMLGK